MRKPKLSCPLGFNRVAKFMAPLTISVQVISSEYQHQPRNKPAHWYKTPIQTKIRFSKLNQTPNPFRMCLLLSGILLFSIMKDLRQFLKAYPATKTTAAAT